MSVISTAADLYFTYKFIRILTTPWDKMEAYKLGIIDDEGNILKKKRDLKTAEEKRTYSYFNRLVWNLKKLLNKLPLGKTRLASYAAALWLIKEQSKNIVDGDTVESAFLKYVEMNGGRPNKMEESADLPDGLYSLNESKQLMVKEGTVGGHAPVGRCLGVNIYRVHGKVFSSADLKRIEECSNAK